MGKRKIIADLHMHTKNSDGTFIIDEVPKVAKDKFDLSAVAITDHDVIQPNLSEPLTVINGIDVINGIELRVEVPEINERVDILGYGVQTTKKLEKMTAKIRKNRKIRAEKIINCVEDKLDVNLKLEPTKSMGRPHIARAIDKNTDYTYTESFEKLIGNDNSCYTPREIPSFKEGLEVLSDACYCTVLAHPYRYDNPEKTFELISHLDGIECDYTYSNLTTKNKTWEIAEENNKIKTGGSDAHDKVLGRSGLNKDEYIEFLKKSGLDEFSAVTN